MLGSGASVVLADGPAILTPLPNNTRHFRGNERHVLAGDPRGKPTQRRQLVIPAKIHTIYKVLRICTLNHLGFFLLSLLPHGFILQSVTMDASETTSSSSIRFRSKKTFHSNSKSLLPDQQSVSSMTPEKPAELSTRTRNRKVALSIKEVRKAAESVRESNKQQPPDRTGMRKSVRRQIDSWPDATPANRSKSAIDKPMEIPEK